MGLPIKSIGKGMARQLIFTRVQFFETEKNINNKLAFSPSKIIFTHSLTWIYLITEMLRGRSYWNQKFTSEYTYREEEHFTVSPTSGLKLELHCSHGDVFVGTLLASESLDFEDENHISISAAS